MKKTHLPKTSLMVLAIIWFSTALSVNAGNGFSPAGGQEGPFYENTLKVNLSSLLLYNFSFQYERVIGPSGSVTLGVNYRPDLGVPFASLFKRVLEDQEAELDLGRMIDAASMSFLSVTPEFRFYPGSKGAPNGLYLAPFVRYAKWDMVNVFEFTPEDTDPFDVKLDGGLSYLAGGIMIGFQWQIGQRTTLDWWLAGPYIGAVDGSFFARGDQFEMSEQDKRDLEQEVRDLDLIILDLDARVKDDGVDVFMDGYILGLRTMGFTIGYRF